MVAITQSIISLLSQKEISSKLLTLPMVKSKFRTNQMYVFPHIVEKPKIDLYYSYFSISYTAVTLKAIPDKL